jgi:hypothetical protein
MITTIHWLGQLTFPDQIETRTDTNQLFQQSWLDQQAAHGNNTHITEKEMSKTDAVFKLLTFQVPGFQILVSPAG